MKGLNSSKMFLENAKMPTSDYRSTSSESNFKYAKISCENYRDTSKMYQVDFLKENIPFDDYRETLNVYVDSIKMTLNTQIQCSYFLGKLSRLMTLNM